MTKVYQNVTKNESALEQEKKEEVRLDWLMSPQKVEILSLLRRQESRPLSISWIPAFAGMTKMEEPGLFTRPSGLDSSVSEEDGAGGIFLISQIVVYPPYGLALSVKEFEQFSKLFSCF